MNQVLEQRYIDKHKLFSLLARLFPNGDFSVEVRVLSLKNCDKSKRVWQDTGEHYAMTLPRSLTEVIVAATFIDH